MKKQIHLFFLAFLIGTFSSLSSFAQPASALDFDGTNDYVNITPVVPYSDDFTIEAWIKTSQTNGVIFAWGDPVVNNYTTFEVYSNRLRLTSGMNGSLHYSDGAILVTTGIWTHVAVTRSGHQINLYVNGILDGTFSTTNRSNPSTSSIGAGLLNNILQGFYKGTIDNLRIWNRPLCQAEINNNRNAENPGNTAGLVAHYKFNQGIANSDNGTVTTALDNMGLYNGSLSGFTLNGTQSNWINPGGVAQNSNSTFFPNNTSAFISGFSPSTAFTGQVINISGGNFTGSDNVSAVYFGTTPASAFTVPSSTQILATVGGGNTGVLKLNVGCGTTTASGFIYLEPLSISGFTPQRVLPGGALTILGKGFNSDPLANQVTFDGLFAVVLAATENMLVVRVPLEASINYIYITTGAQSIKSSFPYFVGNRSCSNSSFTPPILNTLPFGDGPIQISSIDINKDTSLDLVIGNYSSGEIKVQRGGGGGTFSLFNTIPTAASPTVMDFGDVNLDGNVDIVCGNTIGYEVFINDGFANLTQLVLNNGGDNVLGLKLTDLNNDGILDLVYSTPLNPSLYVALGNGLGGFVNETAQPLGGMNPSKMVSHDFNKDGNMDIAFVDYSTSNFGVLLGKGNGSFQSVVSYPFGGSAGVDRIVTADFDHDGNYDLAMTSYTDQIFAVFKGNGNGTFTPLASPTNTGGYPNDIQLIDYNGDANIDLIIPIYSTGEVKIFAGNGLGAFSTNPVVISAGPTPNSVAVGDFNRDNQVDFAVTNFSTHQFNVVRNSCPALPKISHNGLWFDGIDDNVTINRPIQNDFTISFWMKTNSDFVASGTNWYDGAGIIAADNNTPGNLGFGISMTKGYLRYGSGDISTTTTDESTIKVNDNKWHHVLVTRSESSGDVQLYIDGVREIASTQIVGKLDGTPNLVLGRVQTIPQHAYEGQLDDIRFYDREFSAAEIADTSIWNREANTSDASLVAYYKLDRDLINESELIAKDHIGSNDGTIDYLSSGGPLFTRSVTTAAGDYSPGSLRWAIRDFTEGTDQLSGKNYIDFSIQEVDPNIILTIDFIDSMSIKSDLVLDGFSAYGSSKNTLAVGSDAQLRIALNFSGLGTRRFGIQLNGAKNSLVRGLSFVGMPNDGGGAHALGFAGSSSHNSITGCWFGVYPDGDGSLTYRNMNGVNLDLDIGYNVIGGPLPEHRNCISNAEFSGIVPNSNNNIIQNNYIGTNPSGVSSMGNGERGISIYGMGNLIKENLISGNINGILGNGSSSLCTIVGNFIGTDVTGVNPLPNTEGIVLGDGNNTNTIQFYTIGDTTKNNGNIIAFNPSNAITLNSLNSTVNNIRISGNTIFENGYGIFLVNGGNQDKVAPSITSAKTFLLSGTCEADDWVELYYDSPASGITSQGRRFLGVANTNGTTWSFPTSLALGDRVTALAIKNTNQGGGKNGGLGANTPSEYNTSEFSSAAVVSDSTPIPQPLGNRGIYLEGNITSGSNLATSFVPTNATDNVTLEAWVKLDSFPSNYLRFIAYNGNSALNGYGIYLDPSGLVSCFVGGAGRGGVNFVGSTISLKSWNHVALVRDSGIWNLYLNGVSQTYNPLSFPQNLAPDTPTDNLVIGNGFGEINPWAGQIDEVKVFNTARTASEILMDMASTNPDGAVGYWNFEEPNGNVALDLSGSGNNATFVHNPLRAIRVTDNSDNGGIGLGSLRQAINDANADTDTDYVDFSLPSGVQTIQPTITFALNNPIFIDGFSQLNTIPGENSMANTNGFGQPINAKLNLIINGAFAGFNDAFVLESNNAEIRGLVVNGYASSSAFNFSNAFSNVNFNKISGCYIGTNRNGTAAVPNLYGFVASGTSPVRTGNIIGGVNQEDRNLISGNTYAMVDFNPWSNGLIQNNYIGTDAAGNSAIPNQNGAIAGLIWSINTTITSNVISGNGGDAISIGSDFPSNFIITANRIGTLADGTGSLPNNGNGLVIFDNYSNTVGGNSPGDQNIIANNVGFGVVIGNSTAINNRITGNAIFNNTFGGIDLVSLGNNNKPAPAISSAYPSLVTGTCTSGDIIEVFYDSPQSGTTDQGRVYLGQATTSGTTWSFLATLTVGSRITATATDATSGTSPFSVAATVVNFVPGEALDFDGFDDFVRIPDFDASWNLNSNYTFEVWVYPRSTGNQLITYPGACGLECPIWAFTIGGERTCGTPSGSASGKYAFFMGNGVGEIYSDNVITLNKWTHVAVTYDGNVMKMYVDGIAQSQIITMPNVVLPPSQYRFIGADYYQVVICDVNSSPRYPFNGALDEFRIWNRAKCQAEILSSVNSEKPSNNNGLVSRYSFNQGFANINNSSVTTLVDSSGNGHNGILNNFGLVNSTSNWITPGGVLTGSTASSVNCVTAEALDFDGTDDYILLPNGITSQLSGGTMTFESWVKFRGFNNFGSIVKNWSSTGGAFHLGLGDGGVDPWIRRLYLFITQSDGTVVDIGMQSNMLNANVWYHVAFVADGSKISLYVDGLEVDSKPYDGTLKSDVIYSALGVKMDPNSGLPDGVLPGFLNGELDEVRLWSRALCPAEIFNNKNAEKLSNTSGLLFKYDFNQGFVGSANLGLTTLADSSGNGNNATLYNFQLTGSISNWVAPGAILTGSTSTSISCIPGAALDFDGVDDNVNIPNNSSLNTLPLTVECWMNTTTTGVCYEGLVNKYAASSLNGWSLFHTGGTIQAYYYANSSNFIAFPSTGTGVNDGLWHHVAMVVDASGGNIYIDGVLRGRGVWTGTPTACTTNQDLSLGSYPANNQSGACINGYFRGKLDGVRIWSRALCQSEITNNMNAEVPGNSLGLQARYDFNQGFSMSNNAGINTLIDSSGNGNTGTLNNFALVSSTSNWIAPGAVVTGSTTTSVNCIPGAALDFNGFNTYVSTNLWSDTLKNFTMEASVYWRGSTSSDQAILYNGLSSSNGYGIVIRQNIGDELTLLLGGSAWILTGTQLPVNSWSKIVVVNDNKNWSLYLNGTALALSSYTDTAITINGITNSYIGNTQSTNSGFNGTIDNVRFWNRPLCQAEINAHLSCEKPANSAGLIARYDFNSGIAGDNNAGVITAIDSSGNGNHGTLTNFALTSTISNWVAPGAVLSGSTCAGVTIPAGGTWIWVGANSDDWFSPCNWDKLSVPTAAANVLIPGGTLNQPAIRNFPAYCNQIEINTTTGGEVNLDSSSGGQLIITQ